MAQWFEVVQDTEWCWNVQLSSCKAPRNNDYNDKLAAAAPPSGRMNNLSVLCVASAAQLEFVQILVIVVVMMVMVVVITCLLNHYRLSARSLLSRHAPTRRRHQPLANVSRAPPRAILCASVLRWWGGEHQLSSGGDDDEGVSVLSLWLMIQLHHTDLPYRPSSSSSSCFFLVLMARLKIILLLWKTRKAKFVYALSL